MRDDREVQPQLEAPAFHTQATQLVFHSKDPVGSRDYLRCLRGLAELVTPESQGLPSQGYTLYYVCVLAAGGAAGVPTGQPLATYRALLRDKCGSPELPLLEDGADDEHDKGVAAAAAGVIVCVDRPLTSHMGTRKRRACAKQCQVTKQETGHLHE